MRQLIWSPQALLDVQRLYRFLAPKNQDAAKRAVATIRQGVKVLSLQPGVGRPVADMDSSKTLPRALPRAREYALARV